MAAKKKKSKATRRRTKAGPVVKKATGATRKAAAGSKKKAKPRKASADDGAVSQLQRVIDVMVAAGAVEVEMEGQGSKLRVRLKGDQPVAALSAGFAQPMAAVPVIDAAGSVPAGGAGQAAPAPAVGTEVFKSPMVGTFYRSPSPDAESFVKEGDAITEDTTLCIIEAMKVMNEIKAEMGGQVVEILAQNGEPVDYGQPLFTIKT